MTFASPKRDEARAGPPPRIIAYDITRLFLGPLFPTPRGIDRVDLGLAQRIFADPDCPHLGILPTPWGVRAYPARLVRTLLDQVSALWAERIASGDDPALRELTDHMKSPLSHAMALPLPVGLTPGQRIRRVWKLLRATGIRLGRSACGSVPPGAVYLNIGQLGLAVPIFHRWLSQRRDVTCAMMLHDVIPLEYPHLVSDAAAGHHARMVRTVARHADCLIFNTAHARAEVTRALRRHGRTDVPGLVRWLPLPVAFCEAGESPAGLAGVDYCVTVSTIEPRKNHALLIRVWQRMIERIGLAAPHLVIVGALGYRSSEVLELLGANPLLRSRVHLVSGLSSAALASLVLGARAMLSPSLAEGFGLPVLEAAAIGVPTIASDIAAHREIAGEATRLLPPDNEALWEAAIQETPPAGPRQRADIPADLTEDAYCADLIAFLEQAG